MVGTETSISKPMDVAAVIRTRRTIHCFRTQRPSRHLLLAAIEQARWAPNHHQTEPWHFYLLGPETIEAIAQLNAARVSGAQGLEAGARKLERWRAIPGWLVVTCDRCEEPIRSQEDYAACCCAVQNLSLYLWSEGIGVKWTTGEVIRDAAFYDLIWVDPELEQVVGMLWYGYPAEIPEAQRRPLQQILVELP